MIAVVLAMTFWGGQTNAQTPTNLAILRGLARLRRCAIPMLAQPLLPRISASLVDYRLGLFARQRFSPLKINSSSR
jgi:hypothetical protein